MKKRILSAVVSLCLFVGMAVPAFAEYSSQSGSDSDIKILEFAKTSYTVKNGYEIDLSKELTAYASIKQLVQNPSVEWNLENDSKFAFSLDSNGILSANEDSGTANVVVKANGVSKSVKVTATREAQGGATGFNFEKGTYTLFTGADATMMDKDQSIDIIPSPAGTVFTSSQVSEIVSDLNNAISNGNFDIKSGSIHVRPSVSDDPQKISIVYPNGSSSDLTPAQYNYGINGTSSKNSSVTIAGQRISIPDGSSPTKAASHIAEDFNSDKWDASWENSNMVILKSRSGYHTAHPGNMTVSGSGISVRAPTVTPATVSGNVLGGIGVSSLTAKQVSFEVSQFPSASNSANLSRIRRTVSVGCKAAVSAVAINAPTATLTVRVGERVSTASKFKLSPASSNVASSLQYGRDYASTNASYDDFAVLTENPDDPSEIIGVAVGKNKITASITGASGETKTAYITVNVVEKGASTGNSGSSSETDPSKPSLTFTEGNTSVGGSPLTIVVKGVEQGTAISYVSLNSGIARVDANGRVTPVSAGQTKIEITIDGADEKLYCTINVKSASAGGSGGGTEVPKTGAMTLKALF